MDVTTTTRSPVYIDVADPRLDPRPDPNRDDPSEPSARVPASAADPDRPHRFRRCARRPRSTTPWRRRHRQLRLGTGRTSVPPLADLAAALPRRSSAVPSSRTSIPLATAAST